jgi:hypothetical protein
MFFHNKSSMPLLAKIKNGARKWAIAGAKASIIHKWIT